MDNAIVGGVTPGVAGIILVGGQSRRMGQNKALLLMPGQASLTFVEYLASLLAEMCGEVVLVARDQASGQRYLSFADAPRWRQVYDQVPGIGPLMGLLSGLQAASFSHALVLAVDLPFVEPALLTWLCHFPLTDEVLVPRVQGIPQVLLARYPRSVLPVIKQCISNGRRDPQSLLDKVPVHFLEEEQLRLFDPELRSFRNLNTPEDLAHATSWPA